MVWYLVAASRLFKSSEGLWGGCEEKKAADLVTDQSPLKEYDTTGGVKKVSCFLS